MATDAALLNQREIVATAEDGGSVVNESCRHRTANGGNANKLGSGSTYRPRGRKTTSSRHWTRPWAKVEALGAPGDPEASEDSGNGRVRFFHSSTINVCFYRLEKYFPFPM